MNIQKLYNRFIKKANMQKVAGPKADTLRKVLNDFKAMRVNPQQRAELIKARDFLEKSTINDMIFPKHKPELNLLLTPASEFDTSSAYHILNMAEREANRIPGIKGIHKFRERIDKFLKKDTRKAIEKLWGRDLGHDEALKLLQDASVKDNARIKILAKKYLGDI